MGAKDSLLKNLNKILREDEYINTICSSYGVGLETVEDLIVKLFNNLWFDTMDELGSTFMASKLGITFKDGLTQSDKNSIIEAKWKSKGNVDVYLLQSICDSWNNGEIEVDIDDGELILKFVGKYGVPTGIEDLKNQINESKPAYLIANYLFRYLLLSEIENIKLSDLEDKPLGHFAF